MQEKREKRRLQQQELREKRAQVSIFSLCGKCMSGGEVVHKIIVLFSSLIIFMNCNNLEIKCFNPAYEFDKYFGAWLHCFTSESFAPLSSGRNNCLQLPVVQCVL